jgi:hypothetical protein
LTSPRAGGHLDEVVEGHSVPEHVPVEVVRCAIEHELRDLRPKAKVAPELALPRAVGKVVPDDVRRERVAFLFPTLGVVRLAQDQKSRSEGNPLPTQG